MQRFIHWGIILILGYSVVLAREVVNQDSVRYYFSPVVVTGERYETPRNNLASAVTVINAQSLEQSSYSTVVEAVSAFAPGVFTTQKSNMGFGLARYAAGGISIRGLGGSPNTQNLILIDGRPDFMGIFGHPLADAYPLDNVERIEVLRGPASAVYGTNAMGGVINIITRSIKTDGFETRLQAEYGSYSTRTVLLQHGGKKGAFDYYTTVSYRASDGARPGSGFEAQTYSLRLGYQVSPQFNLSANTSVTPYKFDDSGPVVGIPAFDHGKVRRETMEINLHNQFHRADGSIKFHRNAGKHDFTDGWHSKDATMGAVAFQNFHLPKDITLTLGFDFKTYGGLGKSSGVQVADKTVQELAGYTSIQKILWHRLVLNAGIRYENSSEFGAESIPRLGLVYNLSKETTLRAALAKGFRSPSVRELFFFQSANSALKPEKLWSYEAGFSHRLANLLQLEIDGYFIDAEQLIQVLRNKLMNSGANTLKGFELSLTSGNFHNFQLQIVYAYMKPDQKVLYSPNRLTFRLNYQWHRLSSSISAERVQDLYGLHYPNPFNPTTVRMDNYSIVRANLRYALHRDLSVRLTVDNITDQEYQVLFGYPMPGRSVRTGFTYHF